MEQIASEATVIATATTKEFRVTAKIFAAGPPIDEPARKSQLESVHPPKLPFRSTGISPCVRSEKLARISQRYPTKSGTSMTSKKMCGVQAEGKITAIDAM